MAKIIFCNSDCGVSTFFRFSPDVTNLFIKFGYSEKATKFEKIFHLKFDATKGQLIPKWFFVLFDFLKKTIENKST